jgi:hypothetical protein
VTVVDPLENEMRSGNIYIYMLFYQLSPATVMGLQLNPTGTSRPVRSRPMRDAASEAALLLEGTTLEQHWGELGGVTGGGVVPLGMAAARV